MVPYQTGSTTPHIYDHSGQYNATVDREHNYLGQKISKARKHLGLSLSAFKKRLERYGVNISVPAINKWELGETSPNAYQLLALGQALGLEEDYTYFMSTSHHAQLNHEGIQKLAAYRDDLIATGKYKPEVPKSSILYREMPISCLTASAGTGAFLDEGNFEMLSFPESSIPDGADFGVRVSGDSMEPVYHSEQIVWVHRCNTLTIGSVGIFVYDGEGYIKAYGEQMPSDNVVEDFTDSYGVVHPQPILVSFNQKYSPKVVAANSDFRIIGRVL